MADRLVQQHAAPAVAEHHRHAAGRRRNRFQVEQRLAHRLAGVVHGAVVLQEVAVVGTPATAVGAAFAATVLLDDHADVEAHQRAHVGAQAAVGGRHQHLLPDPGEAHRDPRDARVQRTGGLVDALEQFDLLRPAEHLQRIVGAVQARRHLHRGGVHAALLAGAGDRARRADGLAQGVLLDAVAVGKAGLLAGLGAHADALVEVEAAFLDDAVLEHPRLGHLALEVQVGGIDAGPGQLAEQRRQALQAEAAGGQQLLADG
ncbi:hypothetical protein D3C81_1171210 [compost metagenome]